MLAATKVLLRGSREGNRKLTNLSVKRGRFNEKGKAINIFPLLFHNFILEVR
jgi:hypothetical protein